MFSEMFFFIQTITMSLAIENLIQSSVPNEYNERLGWIPYSDITDVKSVQIDNIYYASRKQPDGKMKETMLLLIGSSEECTPPALVSEFARIYSLPTHKYNSDVNHFRRYK